jgi:hypothetical protein
VKKASEPSLYEKAPVQAMNVTLSGSHDDAAGIFEHSRSVTTTKNTSIMENLIVKRFGLEK